MQQWNRRARKNTEDIEKRITKLVTHKKMFRVDRHQMLYRKDQMRTKHSLKFKKKNQAIL